MCDSAGQNPFPNSWRRGACSTCHVPVLLRDGAPRTKVSTQPAHICMVEAIRSSTCPVTVLETGPLSCVSRAFQMAPELTANSLAHRIVWMGGAVWVPGNVQGKDRDGSAEWNAYWDPHAVDQVLNHGPPIHICPLDCSQGAPLTSDLLYRLSCTTHAGSLGDIAASLLVPMMNGWTGVCYNSAEQRDEGEWTPEAGGTVCSDDVGPSAAAAYAWDALAASYILWPDIFHGQPARLQVALDTNAAGRLSAVSPSPPVSSPHTPAPPPPASSTPAQLAAEAPGAKLSPGPASSFVLTGVDAVEWEQRVIRLFGSLS